MTADNLAALLSAREKELSAIYENVPGIVFYIAVEPDGEFRFLSVSRDFLTATGLTREQVVGFLVREVVPPPSCDMVVNRYQEAVRSGQTVRWEEKSLYPAGQKYGEVAVTPLYDASGVATHLIGIVHDITERKRLEERRAEELLQAAPDGMVVVDQKGKIVLVNAQAERLFGYEREEILGQNVEVLIPHRFRERHEAHRVTFVSGPRARPMGASLQLFALRKDGMEFPVEISLSPIEAPNGILLISAIRDITERRTADQALRESEEKFRRVFRDAGVGMVIVSPEGRFLAANRTFCDYLGYIEDELLTKTVKEITFPEDWPAFSQALSETLKGDHSFQWVQKRCLHKSGRIIYTESSASVIRSSEGHPQYLVGEVLDITNRKEAEEALSHVNRRLIEAQDQERTRIARELHDDINQRLALLLVELEASRKNPPSSATDVSLLLTAIRERMDEISSDLEALSHRLHSSKLEYLGLVAAMKSFCNELSTSQDIEINFHQDKVPSHIPSDITLCLFRVLQEALHNAIKHSKVRHFEVRLSCLYNELHLAVSDRGVGFDAKMALTKAGLGLISMRERVRLVNGTVAIDSKQKGGTSIYVRVPLTANSGETRAAG